MFKILLIIFIIFVILYILFKPKKPFKVNFPIDVVYTWVEVDSDFEKEKEYWSKILKMNYNMSNRFEDHQELKYSLRSLETYFPYFRNVYIIVKDGQIPKYLKSNHPRLKFINHSDIIPQIYLPTFNALVIEQYLHHIPGLSNYYLYLNDDFMFLNSTQPEYFFNAKGKIYATHGSNYSRKIDDKQIKKMLHTYDFMDNLAWNNFLLDKLGRYESIRYDIQHVPKMYCKKFDYLIENQLKKIKFLDSNLFDNTSKNKFRNNADVAFNIIMKHYLYKYWFNNYEAKRYSEMYISLDTDDISTLLNSNKLFLCVNDTINYKDEEKANQIIQKLKNTLEQKYPKKSSFEI
jgi:hypothetical protein